MKFTVIKEKLQKSLHIVGRAVNTRSPLPVLANVLIKTEKGRIKLTASDLQINISSWIGAKVDEEGEITVPAKFLTEFINQIADEKVEAELEGAVLKVKTEKAKATFSGIPASEFPQIDVHTDGIILKIKSEDLIKAISSVQFTAALDEGRPVMTGLFCKLDNEKLIIAGTDGYRMAEYKLSVEEASSKEPFTCVIPAKAFADIVKSFAPGSKSIELLINKERNIFVIKVEDMEAQLRMIDGEYPDYEAVVPTEFTGEMKISRSELLNGIKLASIFTKDSGNSVKIIAKEDSIESRSQPTEAGSNVTNLTGEFTGEEIEITFNARYLLDFLNNIEETEIIFKTVAPLKPGLFKLSNNNDYFFLAMPMKANW